MFKMVKKQGLQICTFQIMEILKYWSNRSRSNHLDRGSVITIIAKSNYLDFFLLKSHDFKSFLAMKIRISEYP